MRRVYTVRNRSTAPSTGPMATSWSFPSLTCTAIGPSSRCISTCAASIPAATSPSFWWATRVTCCGRGRFQPTRARRWLLSWEGLTSRLQPGRTTKACMQRFCTCARRWAVHWEEGTGRRGEEDYTLLALRVLTCRSLREGSGKCCLLKWNQPLLSDETHEDDVDEDDVEKPKTGLLGGLYRLQSSVESLADESKGQSRIIYTWKRWRFIAIVACINHLEHFANQDSLSQDGHIMGLIALFINNIINNVIFKNMDKKLYWPAHIWPKLLCWITQMAWLIKAVIWSDIVRNSHNTQ